MGGTRQSNLGDEVLEELRVRYESGVSVPELICDLHDAHGVLYPFDVMYVFMDAFSIGLSDVSCVDGWWPPREEAAISDDKLDRFIRDAIEARRDAWSGSQ